MRELNRMEAEHKRIGDLFYYRVRESFQDDMHDMLLATAFIFLNKAGFNGLYRVNKNGKCNVPWGKRPDVRLYDPENLQACATVLQDVHLMYGDFAAVVDTIECDATPSIKGAVIYCDPPYVPVSKTANFTSYTADGFTYADQIRLLAKAVEWRRLGATVFLSQAADEGLIEQYARCGFQHEIIEARRNINSKGDGRGLVKECLFF
jgi:DNA adenine methylase